MKMKDFIDECGHMESGLVRAVIKQVGTWSDFKEMAQDVANHGADAGFSGFIYYNETTKFYAHNRKAIEQLTTEMAGEMGQGVLEFVQSFNCLGSDYALHEIGQTLYGAASEHQTQVANALAWFALEEVCRRYADVVEA